MKNVVKCRYSHCKHNSKELNKDDAVLVGKSTYYHKDCYREMQDMKNVVDLYYNYVDKHPNYSLLQKTIRRLVYEYKCPSGYLVYAVRYAIEKGWLKHELGITYIVKDDKIKDAYKKYINSKIQKQYYKVTDEQNKGTEFVYKSQPKKSLSDLLQCN